MFLALPAPPEELANNYFNLAPTPLVPAPPMPPYPPPVAMLRGPPPIGMFWINLYYCCFHLYEVCITVIPLNNRKCRVEL